MTDTQIRFKTALLPPNWKRQVVYCLASQSDLPAMEWEGQYRHFRRAYAETYARMEQGTALIWLAKLNELLLGQLSVQFLCDRKELADGHSRAYIYSFRIRPAYRSQGLGSCMLAFVEQDLLDRNYTWATLNVAKTNTRARALYERLGYQVVAHEPGIWSYPDDQGIYHTVEEPAWRMEKLLKQKR